MSRKVRLGLAAFILLFSIGLLIWAYAPNPREMRVREIPAGEIKIP